ncbi:MAG: EFR1 family ferrodoxin [Coriobacteriales bacterium]|jgi:ferredoxin
MILYFTGTGNSKYVAERIASATDQNIINMADLAKHSQPRLKLEEGEILGIVTPTYAFGLPSIVEDLLEDLTVDFPTPEPVSPESEPDSSASDASDGDSGSPSAEQTISAANAEGPEKATAGTSSVVGVTKNDGETAVSEELQENAEPEASAEPLTSAETGENAGTSDGKGSEDSAGPEADDGDRSPSKPTGAEDSQIQSESSADAREQNGSLDSVELVGNTEQESPSARETEEIEAPNATLESTESDETADSAIDESGFEENGNPSSNENQTAEPHKPRPYVFLVATYGSNTGVIGRATSKALQDSGVELVASYGVKMQDNYTPLVDVTDEEDVRETNEEAEPIIDEVISNIEERKEGDFIVDKMPAAASIFRRGVYKKIRKTSNFTVTTACIGCGQCARICPSSAIIIQNNRPKWVKGRCVLCFGCLHRCPKFAIQYGEKTRGHGQYVNPNVEL